MKCVLQLAIVQYSRTVVKVRESKVGNRKAESSASILLLFLCALLRFFCCCFCCCCCWWNMPQLVAVVVVIHKENTHRENITHKVHECDFSTTYRIHIFIINIGSVRVPEVHLTPDQPCSPLSFSLFPFSTIPPLSIELNSIWNCLSAAFSLGSSSHFTP